LSKLVNKLGTSSAKCEHILLTNCWNSIATSLLQVCYNLCVFTRVQGSVPHGTNSEPSVKPKRLRKMVHKYFLTRHHEDDPGNEVVEDNQTFTSQTLKDLH
jgi:hypothetical protein